MAAACRDLAPCRRANFAAAAAAATRRPVCWYDQRARRKVSHEATRVHGASRRGGRMAAHGVARSSTRQMRRIGILTSSNESDPEAQASIAAFREELGKLGWTEGRNLAIDIRWANADAELMARSAKEFTSLQPDVILTSSTLATGVMLQNTRTIPIVFVLVADPVGSGYVASLPRPGGNVTGLHSDRGLAGRQMGGVAEADRPAHRQHQPDVQPAVLGELHRNLSRALQDRRCVARPSDQRCACSRHARG